MLNQDLLNTLKQYTANMERTVCFVLATGEHAKRDDLVDFLDTFASVSDKLRLEQRNDERLRSPVSFYLEVEGEHSGIIFSGIPAGHEFNSLVLAVLQLSGTQLKLDDSIQSLIKGVRQPLNFEVFVSLSCHNCPDVVQALNQFAILNPNIRVETIDGGLFPALIEERNIQGVPSVFLNGESFANGKISTGELIDKLIKLHPEITNESKTEALPLQDVTIIGAGPAGVTAAVYCARKGLSVTVVADRIGGQVKDTMDIENLVALAKTTGPELTEVLHSQLRDHDVIIKEHLKVEEIIPGNQHQIRLSSGEVIATKTVIVATGARWRELGIPGEKESVGNGVAYCPHCDGPFFKGKDVAVVGGGNSGVEAALDLSGIVKSVKLFEFNPSLKADKVLVDKALERENIEVFTNVACKEITATNGKVTGLNYENRENGKLERQELAGVFVQIGLVPNSQFAKGVLELTQYGEVIIDEKAKTSVPGIFACGDVTTVPYKQIVISMGEGAKAALSAFDYLVLHS